MIETLAHFRIVEKIGAGGMGEVYLAEDTRLRRRVALKVLPPELAQHRDRLRRFEREACAASGLSHPNILVVYEIGEDAGRHYIATEYVDGQTLRRRMAASALPAAEALEVAVQVAAALAAAHEAGIVHRDVKPDNIMVRADGYVKVVDFGLAKLGASEADEDAGGEQAHTRTDTEPGKVMGTVEYMSPEQARGLGVDARSDIFSLGAVLYEALAGRPPFQGATRSDVLAALLATEPPPLPRAVESSIGELRWILAKMLRKERDERYQSARELLIDLKRAKQALDRGAPAVPPARGGQAAPPPSGRLLRRVGIVLGAALLAAVAYTAWTSRSRPATPVAMGEPKLGELFRFDSAAGAWRPFLPGLSAYHLDFSPDGQWIAYVDFPEGTLCRSRSDGSGRTQLTFPPLRAGTPRWSPDGTQIVFVAAQAGNPWKVHVIAPDRSPAWPLRALPPGGREERTPGWSADGRRIVFAVPGGDGDDRTIRIVDLATGRESAVAGSEGLYSPRFSPDGRHLLAISSSRGALWVMDVAGGRWRELAAPNVSWPQWSRDGRHIFFNTLEAAGVYRTRVADGATELWAALEGLPHFRIEPFGAWLGLTPDDSPLLLGPAGQARAGPPGPAELKERSAARPAW